MPGIKIKTDTDGGKTFRRALKGTTGNADLEKHEVEVYTLGNATESGMPIVMFKTKTKMPNGETKPIQITLTARSLLRAVAMIKGHHPECTDERTEFPVETPGHEIKEEYRGIKYGGVLMQEMYMMHTEVTDGVLIAGSEKEVESIAKHVIDQHYTKIEEASKRRKLRRKRFGRN